MSDLMYLDYFNGMSAVPNSATVRLYKLNASGEGNISSSHYICSAPLTQQIAYGVANVYSPSSGGLIANALKKFAQGSKDSANMFGGALMAAQAVSDLFGKISPDNSFSEFMEKNHEQVHASMTSALQAGSIETVMPYEETKVYNKSSINITFPASLSFTVASSENFYDYINKAVNRKYTTGSNIFGSIDSLKNALINGEDLTSLERDARWDYGYIHQSTKPVLGYCKYLIRELGGIVKARDKTNKAQDKKTGKALDNLLQGIIFKDPTNNDNNTIMSTFLETGVFDLETPDKGTLWMAIGDYEHPMFIKSLFPKSIQIEPSKYRTPDGDYAWAKITIDLEFSKMLSTNVLTRMIDNNFTYDFTGWDGNEKFAGGAVETV